jgi:hypothetical protein
MKNSIGDRFDGRLKTASEAKQQRLERFKAAADDPEKLARRAERHAVAASLEAERKIKFMKLQQKNDDVERQRAKIVERQGAETLARDAELETEHAEAVVQEIEQNAVQEADRKAERDRRYAARRNRKR